MIASLFNRLKIYEQEESTNACLAKITREI